MSKSLGFSAVFVLLLALSFPAAAQDAGTGLSSIPAEGAKVDATGAAPGTTAATRILPSGSYNVGVRPINLNPGAYVGAQGGQQRIAAAPKSAATLAPGRVSYPPKTDNSAVAYNQRLISTQLKAERRSQSIIPSPFPDGF